MVAMNDFPSSPSAKAPDPVAMLLLAIVAVARQIREAGQHPAGFFAEDAFVVIAFDDKAEALRQWFKDNEEGGIA